MCSPPRSRGDGESPGVWHFAGCVDCLPPACYYTASDQPEESMQLESDAAELGELLRRYLWEYDPARLSWETSRHTIVSKLLQVGGWDAVRWLRAQLTDDELREFLV